MMDVFKSNLSSFYENCTEDINPLLVGVLEGLVTLI
ncbi:hypothetical protein ABID46_002490 [Moheibacter stercoris]|uniref:Uncharacterized protein n=1 Tax=Moheibacter stercoris TaxID=1628251 RepID=A0ABV2LWG4_9FLAO